MRSAWYSVNGVESVATAAWVIRPRWIAFRVWMGGGLDMSSGVADT